MIRHKTFRGRTLAVTVAELPAAAGDVTSTRRTDAAAEPTNVSTAATPRSAEIPRIILLPSDMSVLAIRARFMPQDIGAITEGKSGFVPSA